MKKKIIAFDLGLNFGYCGGKSVHGCLKVGKKRMYSFYNAVLDLLVTERQGKMYDAIVYENACFQKGVAIYNFNAQKGILQMLAESLNIDFVGIPPATIKKTFAKNGKATKEEMLQSASAYLGKKITNHNEADAVGVYYTYHNLK